MLYSFLSGVLIFGGITVGLAWPLTKRLALDPAEKLTATVALSLIGIFLFAWTIYVFAMPLNWFRGLPLIAMAGLVTGWRSLRMALRDSDVRTLVFGQFVVSAWCIGWLALVHNYSGGGWTGDWLEHWQRTQFFIERQPIDRLFLEQYSLPARPPLANIVIGAFLLLTRPDFAHFQFFTTLFGSLVFLPAGLLARRWGQQRAIALVAVLMMLNPLFVQNSTFAWTKLPAAFFILSALGFFLRNQDKPTPRVMGILTGVTLAAGLLTHYSAAPYALLFATAWLASGWASRRDAAFRRTTVIAVLSGTALLATWFGWSLLIYGPASTFLGNTAITEQAPTLAAQLSRIALNLRDTLVPHLLRSLEPGLLRQASPWGQLRDWWFQLYQLNLLFAFGSLSWLVLGREAWRAARASSSLRHFWFWTGLILAGIVLGVGVHGARDHWGLAHICLQSLIVLGLVTLAVRWPDLGAAWRRVLGLGLVVDLTFGICLHFGVQGDMFERWNTSFPSGGGSLWPYTRSALINLRDKQVIQQPFFAEVLNVPLMLLVAVQTTLLFVAILHAFRVAQASPPHAAPNLAYHRRNPGL